MGAPSAAREQAFISRNYNVLSFASMRQAGSFHTRRPRGSFVIDRIHTSADNGLTAHGIPTDTDNEVYGQVTVKDPLWLSLVLIGAVCEGHRPGI